MQKNAFITAEYNPFHNGHLFQLTKTRQAGAECIVVLMSGNFVQRGECAIISKYERAAAALKAGADLVLEIPVKYVVGGSGCFSYGAIKTALLTGQSGTLSFGAESDAGILIKTAEFLCNDSTRQKIEETAKNNGWSFPRAQQAVVGKELGSEFESAVSQPNNLLAVHYISDAIKLNAPFDFYAVQRTGARHDLSSVKNGFASAMLLRGNIFDKKIETEKYMPEYSAASVKNCLKYGQIFSRERFDTAAVSRLLTLSKNDFAAVNGVNQGLENVFYSAVRQAISLDGICERVKSKRFTYSRLRQICLSAALGIKRADTENGISFINILGFNNIGREFLRKTEKTSDILFTGILSNAKQLGEKAARDIEITENAEYFYNFCLRKPQIDFSPYKFKPIII